MLHPAQFKFLSNQIQKNIFKSKKALPLTLWRHVVYFACCSIFHIALNPVLGLAEFLLGQTKNRPKGRISRRRRKVRA